MVDLTQLARGDRVRIRRRWYEVVSFTSRDINVLRQGELKKFALDAIEMWQPKDVEPRPNRRKPAPLRQRYTVMVNPALHQAILEHQFPLDTMTETVNRILLRLLTDRSFITETTDQPLPDVPRHVQHLIGLNQRDNKMLSFRAHPIVHNHLQAIFVNNPDSGEPVLLRNLMARASSYKPSPHLTDDEQAFVDLQSRFQTTWTNIRAIDALNGLKQHASDRAARQFLMQLERKGWITLHLTQNAEEPLVTVGPKKRYFNYIRLTKGLPRLPITMLRRQLFKKQPELATPSLIVFKRRIFGYLVDSDTVRRLKLKLNPDRVLDVHMNHYSAHYAKQKLRPTDPIDDLQRTQWKRFSKSTHAWYNLGKDYDAIRLYLRHTDTETPKILLLLSKNFDIAF